MSLANFNELIMWLINLSTKGKHQQGYLRALKWYNITRMKRKKKIWKKGRKSFVICIIHVEIVTNKGKSRFRETCWKKRDTKLYCDACVFLLYCYFGLFFRVEWKERFPSNCFSEYMNTYYIRFVYNTIMIVLLKTNSDKYITNNFLIHVNHPNGTKNINNRYFLPFH